MLVKVILMLLKDELLFDFGNGELVIWLLSFFGWLGV